MSTSTVATRAVRVGAVVVAQLALVGVAVWPQLSARLTGEEVILRVQPVDPVDPFRGAYVDLAYPDLPDQPRPGRRAFDEEQQEARRGDAARHTFPDPSGGRLGRRRRCSAGPPAEGLYLTCDDSDWRLRCGIESLFLPQDKAAGLEEAVAPDGGRDGQGGRQRSRRTHRRLRPLTRERGRRGP